MPPTAECRDFGYRADDEWAKLPAGWSWNEAPGVATDSQDRVYVFHRGEHPVLVFDREGNFLRSWGEGIFVRPHGITIGPDDSVYCTDDQAHVVHKFSPDGRLLMTLGTPGKPSDTGATSNDFRTVKYSGPPFNFPTNLAIAPNGDLFISDGYGNARVHHYSPDGKLLNSWGEPGAGKGQFHIPHGIAIDAAGSVWVADRENSRIQIFTPEGKFVAEWTDVAVRHSKEAERLGADGVMVVPPFYSSPTEDELFEHYRRIAEAIGIPVMIYNNPNTANVDLSAAFVARLAQIDNVRYIKESSGDIHRVSEILRLCGDRMTVLAGYHAFDSMLLGAQGWVSVCGNIVPALSAKLYELTVAKGDVAAGRAHYNSLLPLLDAISGDLYVSATKAALNLIGMPMGQPRPPRLPLPAAQVAGLRRVLIELGALKDKAA